ncbi:MAG TPA: AMP-binding protein, partial [Lautropia sp.]|nr:AMP-binding protein [Lautropia sp.]
MPRGRAANIRSSDDIELIERSGYDAWAGARSTYELLRQSAQAQPEGPAIVYVHDPADPQSTLVWSHRELLGRIHRAAALFRDLNVSRDVPIALLVPHIPSAQVALWGAQLAGCAFPINFLLNAEHVAQLLQAAGARVVVALGPAHGLSVHETVCRAIELADNIRHVVWVDPNELQPAAGSFQSQLDALPDQWLAESPAASDLAALYHTGGTTGLPKLLRHTHANEVHVSRSAPAFYDFGAGDRILNGFPLFHVAGAFVYGLSCLAAGGSLFIPTLTGLRNTEFLRRAWQWLDRCEVTHLGCVPTALAALLTAPRGAGEAGQVRLALTGGSP